MDVLKNCTDKAHARKHFKAVRDNTDEKSRRIADEAICEALTKTQAFAEAQVILTYFPIGSEIDIRTALERAWQNSKSVAFPRTARGSMMDWHTADSFDELHASRFGLMEPKDDPTTLIDSSCKNVFLNSKTPVLVLVPGLVFDRKGYRLGYGGGYYDTLLSRLKKTAALATSIGVVRQNCVVDDLDGLGLKDAHDVAVDKLIVG